MHALIDRCRDGFNVGIFGFAVLFAALAASSATNSASATLFSSAGVSAVQGSNTRIFREFSEGTDFASEVGISGPYTASAIAQTAIRSNHITASAGKTTLSGFSDAGATSRWSDGLFFAGDGSEVIGTDTGLVTFVFSLSGNIEGDDTVGFNFDFDRDDEYDFSDNIGHVFRGPATVAGFEISLEGRFTFNAGLDPLIIEAELFGGANVGRNETGSASTNFGNSAILTQVILPDGVSITSASGTDYSQILQPSTASVPEPETLGLFGLGLAGFAFAHGLRRLLEVNEEGH